MKEYLDVLQDILDNGREKESGRANMPNTIGLSHATILMKDVNYNFPLLTTKKMFWKGVVHELLWFLRGETNIKYLVDNKVNIWNGDAYRWYQTKCKECELDILLKTQEEFIETVKNKIKIINSCGKRVAQYNDEPIDGAIDRHLLILARNAGYAVGDLGKVYGHQWRDQNGVDQIADIFKDLTENPYGRYKILDAWNKKEFPEMTLPPCHLLYQFIVRPMTFEERKNLYPQDVPNIYSHDDLDAINAPKYFLDLNMYQRSCDTFLGVPFNIASMSLLLLIMARAVGMVAGEAFWIGGDTHMYVSHLDAVNEQLSRTPGKLPQMIIYKELNTLEDILELTIDDFELVNYDCQDKITAELFTGLKKK